MCSVLRTRRLALFGVAMWAAGCAPSWPALPSPDPERPPPQTLEEAFAGLSYEPSEARVALLSDNAEAWAARWQLLATAERAIDIVYFIVDKDVFGLSLLGSLYDKARRGVPVRLLVDARGTERLTGPTVGLDYLDELVATRHADVHVFNPPLERTLEALMRFSVIPAAASNHDKILVVDGERAIMGGRNIAALYFASGEVDPAAVIDTDILIEGQGAIDALEVAFASEFYARRRREILADPINLVSRRDELLLHYHAMDTWLRSPAPSRAEAETLRRSPAARAEAVLRLEADAIEALGYLPDAGSRQRFREQLPALIDHTDLRGALPLAPMHLYEAPAHVLDTRARLGPREPRVSEGLLRLMHGAQREIFIESPYFIPTRRAVDALRAAGARSVRVTILTNSPRSSDNALSQAFFLDQWPELMAEVPGLRVFVVGGDALLHAKRAVFDDSVTMIGTYNLDPLSAYVNSEVAAALWSESFAAVNKAEIEARLQAADVLEYRIVRDPRGQARRYPADHPRAGEVMVAFGPDDHCHAPACEEAERLRPLVDLLHAVPGFDALLAGP